MTQQELEKVCEKWKARLGLQNWTIKIRFVKSYSLAEGNQGEVAYVHSRQEAMIRIQDPGDYDPDSIEPQDVELSVVHELLEIVFGHFRIKKADQDESHQWLHNIAKALIKTERMKGGD